MYCTCINIIVSVRTCILHALSFTLVLPNLKLDRLAVKKVRLLWPPELVPVKSTNFINNKMISQLFFPVPFKMIYKLSSAKNVSGLACVAIASTKGGKGGKGVGEYHLPLLLGDH